MRVRPLKPTRLDRAIETVAPGWAARRYASRKLLQVSRRRERQLRSTYEGARTDRKRGYDWILDRVSTDDALESDLETLRLRARDLYRNDPIVSGIIEDRVQKIIGNVGVQPVPNLDREEMVERAKHLKSPFARRQAAAAIPSQDEVDEYNRRLSDVWDEWQKDSDSTGLLSFVEIEQQIHRNLDNDGEVIVLIENVERLTGDKPVPLSLRVVSASRLETPPTLQRTSNIRLGVEYNDDGERVAYHIRNSEPAGSRVFRPSWRRVSILDDNDNVQIVHLFEQQWPDQSRGVPYISPAMTKLKDLKDWDENELVAKSVEACLSIFITRQGQGTDGLPSEAADETTADGDKIENIMPGMISYLNEDESIETVNPQRPGANYAPFVEWQTLRLAGCLVWPYEWIVKDYRKTSFSAGRLAGLDGGITIRCRQRKFSDHLLRHIWARFVDQCFFGGVVQFEPLAYRLLGPSFRRYRYAGPVRPAVDELKEAQAVVLKIQHRLMTYAEYYSQRGQHTYADTFRQIAREQRLIEAEDIGTIPAAQPEGVPSPSVPAPTVVDTSGAAVTTED